MNVMKNINGITLISIVVTIIVLLILCGVCFKFFDNSILDKAVMSSDETIDAELKEKIKLAWVSCEASYLNDKNYDNLSMTKEEYFKTKLLEELNSLDNFSSVNIDNNLNGGFLTTFKYSNKEYKFNISKDGNISNVFLLKENVKLGDYVEYNIKYDDSFNSNKSYTAKDGWRVIDDGVMEGTSGKVKIISTGIPVKWDYSADNFTNNEEAVNTLINDFENVQLIDNVNKKKIVGSYFKIDGIAERLTTLTLEEFNNVYNIIYETDRAGNDTSDLENINDLLCMEAYYWLGSNNVDDNTSIYYLNNNQIRHSSEFRMGIRPVICLTDGLLGIKNSDTWKIVK